jgi:hypothetical protein
MNELNAHYALLLGLNESWEVADNSRVQSIKYAASGFGRFANYRIRILFHCGKLDLSP